jgi:3-keto-5-aminohexanoate cleavage enzyme
MNPAPVVITVGPTGAQATRENTPYLPLTAEEIAAEVTAAYEAGASVASLHLRDAEGLPTADLEIGRRTIALIQEQSPILVQLSSGVSPTADLEDRLRLMDLKPRMATLSLCSMTFGQVEFRNPPDFVRRLAERMQELNIKPELEVYDTGHVDAALALAADGLLSAPLQFGIVMGVRGGMAATHENLLSIVRRLPEDAVWQAIAIGRHNFDFAALAMTLGGNARTGLEDNLYLRRGELSPGNVPLVSKMAAIAAALDRPLATVEETEAMLKLAPAGQ